MSNATVNIAEISNVIPADTESNTSDEVNRGGTKRKLEIDWTPARFMSRPKKRMSFAELNADDYSDRFAQIVDNIWYRCGRVVLVWCPTNLLQGDFVASLASQYGNVVDKRDRFRYSLSQKGVEDWIGVTLFYDRSNDAMKAAKDMPMRSKHIQAYCLQEHINDVADIESRHRSFGPSYSKVIITCRYDMTEVEHRNLRRLCKEFGQLRDTECMGNTFVATFKYLTHAYLAVRILDQKILEPVGKIYACLEQSKFNDDIFDELNVKISIDASS